MAHGHEEACPLEVHVGIYVEEGISAYFHAAVTVFLNGKLADLRQIVGGFIFAKPGQAATQFNTQYLLRVLRRQAMLPCIRRLQPL